MPHLGIKAHWRDAPVMADVARETGAQTIEIHLAARDLVGDRAHVLDVFRPLGREFRLVVHQPEWVTVKRDDKFFLNLASPAKAWREESAKWIGETCTLAAALGAAGVIVHPGGMAFPGKLPGGTVEALASSLGTLPRDVPLWLENMPWFYFSGADATLALSCLGVQPDDYAAVDALVDGYCLDTAHAFLATREGASANVVAWTRRWGARIRHVHAAGAQSLPDAPQRGEGLPFNESQLDLEAVAQTLRQVHASAAVVPEIKGGENAGGLGFRQALQQLAPLLPPST